MTNTTNWLMRVDEIFHNRDGRFKAIGEGCPANSSTGQPMADFMPVTLRSQIPYKNDVPNIQFHDVLHLKTVIQKNNNPELFTKHDSVIDVIFRQGLNRHSWLNPPIRAFEWKIADVLNLPTPRSTPVVPLVVREVERPTMNISPKAIPENISNDDADFMIDRPCDLD
uniref:Uncharacterized protein n=1 Tax=Panagrolaimus sp. JU765 TaxID=591449 RepID=A0AC34QM35_9BILA